MILYQPCQVTQAVQPTTGLNQAVLQKMTPKLPAVTKFEKGYNLTVCEQLVREQ